MKKIKILTIILAIVAITMISFLGIYVQYQNRMENKVKDYNYAMDLKGARNIKLEVSQDTRSVIRDANGKEIDDADDLTDEELAEKGYTKQDEPYNNQEQLTGENYKNAKKLIEKRLKNMGIANYEISLNEENGEMLIQVPEDENADYIVSNINSVGKFQILDTETGEVLMDNNDIKASTVLYGSDSTQTTNGTSVYLNIDFDKEGAKKLEEITSTYIEQEITEEENKNEEETVEETTENKPEETTTETENAQEEAETTEEETETVEKTITMKIDDEKIMTTSFDTPIRTGSIQLSIGSATTDIDTLNDYMKQASSVSTTLDSGKLPVKYNISENEYIMSDITKEQLQYVEIALAVVALIGIIIFVLRYKLNGLLAGIAYIGLASIYLLLIRYTNVVVSIQGIFGIGIILILNYIFLNKVLAKINKTNNKTSKVEINKLIKESYKEFFIKIIPICIATIVFCFTNWTSISSFGMVMFWGITLIALYNYIVTSTILKIKADK